MLLLDFATVLNTGVIISLHDSNYWVNPVELRHRLPRDYITQITNQISDISLTHMSFDTDVKVKISKGKYILNYNILEFKANLVQLGTTFCSHMIFLCKLESPQPIGILTCSSLLKF